MTTIPALPDSQHKYVTMRELLAWQFSQQESPQIIVADEAQRRSVIEMCEGMGLPVEKATIYLKGEVSLDNLVPVEISPWLESA
jgi:hypothetical protein